MAVQAGILHEQMQADYEAMRVVGPQRGSQDFSAGEPAAAGGGEGGGGTTVGGGRAGHAAEVIELTSSDED